MASPIHDEDLVEFEEDESGSDGLRSTQHRLDAPACASDSWKIVIVDDEPDVHRATQLALQRFQFEGKPLLFFSAYSGEQGKQLITSLHADAALILLDVVMETQDAGLKMVQYIRHELKNQAVRIILRTGHPGEAPEESVILDYDINDYKLKVDLTRQRLLTTVVSALRSYRDVMTIEQQRAELTQVLEQLQHTQVKLESYMHTLEVMVAQRTAELCEANKELHRLATLDGLTRVANRHRFDEYWQQQWPLLSQQRQPLALILIDVDFFKQYNDYYGHLAGDKCLQKIARCLEGTLKRPTDLMARYGGEEFVALLPYTNLKGATQLAQSILAAIARLNLPHARSGIGDRITVSLGVAHLVPEDDLSFTTLMISADKALYQAKREGRNRFCVFEPVLGGEAEGGYLQS
ncbi:diguanylate cyclase domain-containing protein [Nodosilinea nodulosa]|uniref:diguanylate cyclase domain-containing protein n=1 Tax=Nodosilinea nodulosa TaxID=416001 RepID=UPI0002F9A78C|nr:diguanylate cyclase [Nodosilinea nodulosa]